ncbi:MAG: RnfABCDGE type electron transport complex subunit B [Acidiferrobacterales bacterium]
MFRPDPTPAVRVEDPLVALIDARLPQTQCTRCGYPLCADYARAIARCDADINRCPPGGQATIASLAALLNRPPKPLDPLYGSEQPRRRAVIDEALCIGCRKCIDACPVDAILGARRLMHTVIAHECSGCELCLAPCPVDCIDMQEVPEYRIPHGLWRTFGDSEAENWRRRNAAHHARALRPPRPDSAPEIARDRNAARARRRDEIRAAVERARRKRILTDVRSPQRPAE